MTGKAKERWLDFSGAPPMLIPAGLVPKWRGTINPRSGRSSTYDSSNPVTDYDRACNAAWPGRGVIPLDDQHVLVLYTESDLHGWDCERMIVGCADGWPSDDELRSAKCEGRVEWTFRAGLCYLMNSAVDGSEGVSNDDFMPIELTPGTYSVETCCIATSELYGWFHLLVRTPVRLPQRPSNLNV